MNALTELKDYYKHLDKLIAESSKEDLAECDRLLALNPSIARPQNRRGIEVTGGLDL